jgi:hypothetical protein
MCRRVRKLSSVLEGPSVIAAIRTQRCSCTKVKLKFSADHTQSIMLGGPSGCAAGDWFSCLLGVPPPTQKDFLWPKIFLVLIAGADTHNLSLYTRRLPLSSLNDGCRLCTNTHCSQAHRRSNRDDPKNRRIWELELIDLPQYFLHSGVKQVQKSSGRSPVCAPPEFFFQHLAFRLDQLEIDEYKLYQR